jgi:DNA-binding transcriptional ArsR family regulator
VTGVYPRLVSERPAERTSDNALAHPLRARIFQLMADQEASATEIARTLSLAVPTVSYHVRALASAGLIEQTRTTRKRGAVETHFRARPRPARPRRRRHWTTSDRRVHILPVVEEIVEGLDVEDTLGDPMTVLFFEADHVDPVRMSDAGNRLLEWGRELRALEAASWMRGPGGLRWYAAPAWLGEGHPPPGASRLSLVHSRGDELSLRPAVALPHSRAVQATDPPPQRICELADAPALDALLHPLRIRIFRLLLDPGSATELSAALGETVANVSYHLRVLKEAALVSVVGEARRRGATETYFRARAALDISEPEWRKLSPAQRRRFTRTAQRESIQSLRLIATSGGFDDHEVSILYRLTVRLDDDAATAAAELLMQLHIDLAELAEAERTETTTAITVGAGLLARDPVIGQRLEVRRHRGADKDLLGGKVVDADPASELTPRRDAVAPAG